MNFFFFLEVSFKSIQWFIRYNRQSDQQQLLVSVELKYVTGLTRVQQISLPDCHIKFKFSQDHVSQSLPELT